MKYSLILLVLASLLACKSEPNNVQDQTDQQQQAPTSEGPESTPVENVRPSTSMPEKTEEIVELFEDKTFNENLEINLLQEIRICQTDSNKLQDPRAIPCSPKYFKFFPLSKSTSLDNGFVLLIKAGAGGFPLRRVLVFERDRGTLVKVNGFVANLVGRVKNDSGIDDLVLRFSDKDEAGEDMFYNCLFEYNNDQFRFKQVEVIEGKNWGGKVKESKKAEVSKEIFATLRENQMIF